MILVWRLIAARYTLQVEFAAVPVEAPHPFVVRVEPAEQVLARAGCRDRHDDLPPGSMDRSSERHADGLSGRKLPRVALDATEGALPG
jgi:hypothetical protein